MTRGECQRLIDEYLRWLKEGIHVEEVGQACLISTPFLDRHNDEIEIFAENRGGLLHLTDDGQTLGDLRASGMEFSTEKRKGHLRAILNGFGVRLQDDEIVVDASPAEFAQKKHCLVQAMLAVGDMFVMAEEHVLSLFKEDVAAFFEAYRVPAFVDFKLSGKSGFDHTFDFGLPRTVNRPQRVVRAINTITKDTATSFAFAVQDVRALRSDPLGAIAIINDTAKSPSEEYLAALRAYEVEALFWTQRQTFVASLNGQH